MRELEKPAVSVMRKLAGKTVKKIEPQCGSRMLAYEKVAAVIGVSASWLRKFITVTGTPEPRWSVGYALIIYYENLCDRIDDQVSEQRREIAKIIGEIHEADPFADRLPPSVSLARRLGFAADD